MTKQGKLLKIWIKSRHRGPMDECGNAQLKAGQGLVGSADLGGKRQVTLLEIEQWNETIKELGISLDPAQRRANLLVTGIQLRHSTDRILRVGPCRLKIGGETTPCQHIEVSAPGLRQSMQHDWRGGVYAEVLDDGDIATGDLVTWESQDLPY